MPGWADRSALGELKQTTNPFENQNRPVSLAAITPRGLSSNSPDQNRDFIHLNGLKRCQPVNLTKSRGQLSFPLESPGREAILEGKEEKKRGHLGLSLFGFFFLLCSKWHYWVSTSPVREAGRIVFRRFVYLYYMSLHVEAWASPCCVKPRCNRSLVVCSVGRLAESTAVHTTVHYCMITICFRDWGAF